MGSKGDDYWFSGERMDMRGHRIGISVIDSSVLQSIRDERAGCCDVYWGCHACCLEPGHVEWHTCAWCGMHPYDYSILWGNDMNRWEKAKWARLTAVDIDGNKRRNYRKSKKVNDNG